MSACARIHETVNSKIIEKQKILIYGCRAYIIIQLNITEDDIIKARRPILYLTRNLNSINHNQLTRSHSPYASTLSRGIYIILYGFVIGGSTSDTQSHTHCCGVAAPRTPYINTAECGLN